MAAEDGATFGQVFVNLDIGTPAQSVRLMIDTSSGCAASDTLAFTSITNTISLPHPHFKSTFPTSKSILQARASALAGAIHNEPRPVAITGVGT